MFDIPKKSSCGSSFYGEIAIYEAEGAANWRGRNRSHIHKG